MLFRSRFPNKLSGKNLARWCSMLLHGKQLESTRPLKAAAAKMVFLKKDQSSALSSERSTCKRDCSITIFRFIYFSLFSTCSTQCTISLTRLLARTPLIFFNSATSVPHQHVVFSLHGRYIHRKEVHYAKGLTHFQIKTSIKQTQA